jgi:hypothetical protein
LTAGDEQGVAVSAAEDRRTILVLQMGKVASVAWTEGIMAALPAADVRHIHHLHPLAVERIREQATRTGPTQNIKRVRLLQMGANQPLGELPAKFVDGRWTGSSPLQIVSGIRDPVDRSISMLFFAADFYGHKDLALSFRHAAPLDFLARYFADSWRRSLSDRIPETTFEQFLCQSFLRYRDWFDLQFRDFLHLDLTQAGFDREKQSLILRQGNVDVLGYRFEDLKEGSQAWERLSASASNFLRTPLPALPQSNIAQNRRSRELYSAFRSQITLPDDMLDEIYSAPILRLFYSPAELDAFKSRWRARPGSEQIAALG